MINFSRKVTTRDGRSVRVLCQDADGPYPVVAILTGTGDVMQYTLEGIHQRMLSSHLNLINPPFEGEYWIEMSNNGPHRRLYTRRENMSELQRPNAIRVKVVEIDEE